VSFEIKAQSEDIQVLNRCGDDMRELGMSVLLLYEQLLIIFPAWRRRDNMDV